MFKKLFAALLLCFAFVGQAPAKDGVYPAFEDGDRVVFLGDSITHNGYWHSYIYLYYLTRFPDQDIRFFNSGVSGGKATDAADRFSDDVARRNPTHIVVMLGMNDVATTHYTEPEPERSEATAKFIARYEEYMTIVMEKAKAETPEAKVLLVSSTPYDQVGNQKRQNAKGKNDAIRETAKILEELAEKFDTWYLDFNTPMLEMDAKGKAVDPEFSIIGSDRVHPGQLGHQVMAYLFLKKQGLDTPEMSVVVDAQNGSVVGAEGAKARVVGVEKGKISISIEPESLPYVVDDEVRSSGTETAEAAERFVPFVEDFMQRTVVVKSVPDGNYVLKIDGKKVAEATGAEIRDGVNLSTLQDSPEVDQVREAIKINDRRWNDERILRGIGWVKARILYPANVDITDMGASLAAVNAYREKPGSSKSRYLDIWEANYLKEAELETNLEAVTKELRDAVQPKPIMLSIESAP